MRIKLAIFQTHPIQYFAPVWRQLGRERDIDATVFYLSDSSLRDGKDPDFGRGVTWDVPLLEGYSSVFLSRDRDPTRRWQMRLRHPLDLLLRGGFQCVLVPGYMRPFEWQTLWAAHRLGLGVVMRGEFGPSPGADASSGPGKAAYALKSWARNRILKRIYSSVDAFAVIGKGARTHLSGLGVDPDRLVFSPYSVDSALFNRRPRSAALRSALGIGPKDVVALFSGKLIDRKAPQTLLDALALLPDLPQLKAVFVGDGPLAPDLRAQARRLAPGRAVLAGFVNQSRLADYFAAADLFVLPSLFETWGLVVNEAMQMGLPVIATEQCGCAQDLVSPGKTGELFAAGDAKKLAEHLRNLFLDKSRRRRYSTEASERIKLYSTAASAKGIAQAARLSVALAGKPWPS